MKFFGGFPDSPGRWWLVYRCALLVLIVLALELAVWDKMGHWSEWSVRDCGLVFAFLLMFVPRLFTRPRPAVMAINISGLIVMVFVLLYLRYYTNMMFSNL